MQRSFPITISQYTRRNFWGLYGIGGILVFGWIFVPALATAPPAAAVVVAGMLITAWVVVYVFTLGKKITLTREGVIYKNPRLHFDFLYRDIEKVGYYSYSKGSHGSSGGGLPILSVSVPVRKARIYLKNVSSPVELDLYFFSDENQLLLLEVITQQAPHALFGENIIAALNSRVLPAGSGPRWKIEDVIFNPLKK